MTSAASTVADGFIERYLTNGTGERGCLTQLETKQVEAADQDQSCTTFIWAGGDRLICPEMVQNRLHV